MRKAIVLSPHDLAVLVIVILKNKDNFLKNITKKIPCGETL